MTSPAVAAALLASSKTSPPTVTSRGGATRAMVAGEGSFLVEDKAGKQYWISCDKAKRYFPSLVALFYQQHLHLA